MDGIDTILVMGDVSFNDSNAQKSEKIYFELIFIKIADRYKLEMPMVSYLVCDQF